MFKHPNYAGNTVVLPAWKQKLDSEETGQKE